MHGKTSMIHHDNKTIFSGLPNPFEATRYHSLIIKRETLPPVLEVTAWTDDGSSWECGTGSSRSKGCSSTRVHIDRRGKDCSGIS